MAKDSPDPAVPASSAAPLGRGGLLRILVVDDMADAAESLALLLQMLQYDVRTASSGQQALALAEEYQPHAVVLDLGMPGMDGCEVARQLRASPATARTFIVALSGYGHADHRRLAAEAGCDEYLLKPVQLAKLRDLLARLIPDDGESR